VLRGAGVSLALPWLESLAGSSAKASAAATPKRLLVVFFPSGTSEFWRPAQAGVGDAWQLSPILDPFAALKSRMTVLSGVENHTPVQTDPQIEPSNGRDTGMFLSCINFDKQNAALRLQATNGVTMDQRIAQGVGQGTPLESLAVGLSTWQSYCDGRDCRYSRNISWSSQTEVVPRLVDPVAVWQTLFEDVPLQGGRSVSLDRSVLDAVLESSAATRSRLGRVDQQRLDDYLSSVRDLETRIQGLSCYAPARPTLSVTSNDIQINTDTYNRGDHAAIMNDLLALAFQCDRTRVISHMLDDERSEFVYSHVKQRIFSATGSVENPDGSICYQYNAMCNEGDANSAWASANRWFSQITADLCQKLAEMPEGDGSVLDNTVVVYGSSMHGANNSVADLPIAVLGGRGVLKQNQNVALGSASSEVALRDVYFTIMNSYFGLNAASFGESVVTSSNRLISALLV
jgi:hypothetical protein